MLTALAQASRATPFASVRALVNDSSYCGGCNDSYGMRTSRSATGRPAASTTSTSTEPLGIMRIQTSPRASVLSACHGPSRAQESDGSTVTSAVVSA